MTNPACAANSWTEPPYSGAAEDDSLLSREGIIAAVEENRRWRACLESLLNWPRIWDEWALEEIDKPTNSIHRAAIRLAKWLHQEMGFPAPIRIVPDGEGGVSFEFGSRVSFDVLTLLAAGDLHWDLFRDGKLVHSGPVPDHSTWE